MQLHQADLNFIVRCNGIRSIEDLIHAKQETSRKTETNRMASMPSSRLRTNYKGRFFGILPCSLHGKSSGATQGRWYVGEHWSDESTQYNEMGGGMSRFKMHSTDEGAGYVQQALPTTPFRNHQRTWTTSPRLYQKTPQGEMGWERWLHSSSCSLWSPICPCRRLNSRAQACNGATSRSLLRSRRVSSPSQIRESLGEYARQTRSIVSSRSSGRRASSGISYPSSSSHPSPPTTTRSSRWPSPMVRMVQNTAIAAHFSLPSFS